MARKYIPLSASPPWGPGQHISAPIWVAWHSASWPSQSMPWSISCDKAVVAITVMPDGAGPSSPSPLEWRPVPIPRAGARAGEGNDHCSPEHLLSPLDLEPPTCMDTAECRCRRPRPGPCRLPVIAARGAFRRAPAPAVPGGPAHAEGRWQGLPVPQLRHSACASTVLVRPHRRLIHLQ